VKRDLETVVMHWDQMNIGSELFLKEKKKQEIVNDLKMAFGNNIVSEYYVTLDLVMILSTCISVRYELTTRNIYLKFSYN
jgi:hypothetical protein